MHDTSGMMFVSCSCVQGLVEQFMNYTFLHLALEILNFKIDHYVLYTVIP